MNINMSCFMYILFEFNGKLKTHLNDIINIILFECTISL